MTKRRKPLRSYGRRRWPQARLMFKIGLGSSYFTRHPTKGYRPKASLRFNTRY